MILCYHSPLLSIRSYEVDAKVPNTYSYSSITSFDLQSIFHTFLNSDLIFQMYSIKKEQFQFEFGKFFEEGFNDHDILETLIKLEAKEVIVFCNTSIV